MDIMFYVINAFKKACRWCWEVYYSVRKNFSKESTAGLGPERRAGVSQTKGEEEPGRPGSVVGH